MTAATMEQPVYTEAARDRLEEELSAERNKRELLERFSYPWRILAYWLMCENVCTIYVEDTANNVATEFEVPSNQVKYWHEHALAHPDAGMPKIKYQGE